MPSIQWDRPPVEVKVMIVRFAVMPSTRNHNQPAAACRGLVTFANLSRVSRSAHTTFKDSRVRAVVFQEILDILFSPQVRRAAWIWAATSEEIRASRPTDWLRSELVVRFITTQLELFRAPEGLFAWTERLVLKVADAWTDIQRLVLSRHRGAILRISPVPLPELSSSELDRGIRASFHLFLFHDLLALLGRDAHRPLPFGLHQNRYGHGVCIADFFHTYLSVPEAEQMLVLQFGVEDGLDSINTAPRGIFRNSEPPPVDRFPFQLIFPYYRLSPWTPSELRDRFCRRQRSSSYLIPSPGSDAADLTWGFPDCTGSRNVSGGLHSWLARSYLRQDALSSIQTIDRVAGEREPEAALSRIAQSRESYSDAIDTDARIGWVEARLDCIEVGDGELDPDYVLSWYRETAYVLWDEPTIRLLREHRQDILDMDPPRQPF